MKNNLLILIITILSIAIAMFFIRLDLYSKIFGSDNSVRKEIALPDKDVKEYVLGGKVISISENNIKIEVSRTFAGPEGNYIATEEKTVKVSTDTLIYFINTADKKYTKKIAKVADIIVGANLSVYSDKNIATMNSFTPNRIDVYLD